MSKRRSRLIEAGKQAGFQYQTNSPSPSSGFLADGGLLLLSRFPILATDFQAFPKGEDIEGLVNKGVIYAKIQVKDDVVHMFQTHQLADTSVNHRNKRGEGFVVWRDFMKKCFKENNYREGEIALLIGDFNVKGNGPKLSADELAGHPVLTLYPDLVENNDGISEYEAMLAILSENKKDDIEDLLLKKFGEHVSTYAGSIYGGSSQQALDYIFKFTPKSMLEEIEEEGSEEEDKGGRLSVVDDSVKVENFNVEGQPFKQLSDHYGVMVALDYVEGNN